MTTAAAFDKHVECCVCMEVYTNPHVLSCLHTYCLKCLSAINKYGKVECPECRQLTDFSKIKKDFKTQGIVETYHAEINDESADMSINKVKQLNCQVCKHAEKVVKSWCLECKEFLCVDCETAHKGSRASRRHGIKPLIFLQKENIQHKDERLQGYVGDADTKLAVIDKNVKSVKQMEFKQKSQVKQYYQELVENIKHHCDRVLEIISDSSREATSSLENSGQMLNQQKSAANECLRVIKAVQNGDNTLKLSDFVQQIDSDFRNEMKEREKHFSAIQTSKSSKVLLIYGDIDPRDLLQAKMCEIPRELSTRSARLKSSNPSAVNYRRMASAKYKQERCLKHFRNSSCICLVGNELWRASEDRVVMFQHNLNGKRDFKLHDTNCIIGLVKMNRDNAIMACSNEDKPQSGLYQIDRRGIHVCQISRGFYTSIDYHNHKLCAIDYSSSEVAVFSHRYGEWEFQLKFPINNKLGSGHSDNYSLSVNGNGIFISVPEDECIYVYSHSGECLEQITNTIDRTGLNCQRLCGVDAEQNMLMAETGGSRLAVYDHNCQWHVIDLRPQISHYYADNSQCIVSDDMSTLWINVSGNVLYKYSMLT